MTVHGAQLAFARGGTSVSNPPIAVVPANLI
jgi:hypothetical protein